VTPTRKKHCLSLNASTIRTINNGAKKTVFRTSSEFLEQCLIHGGAKVEREYPKGSTKRPAKHEQPVSFARRIDAGVWADAEKSLAKTNLTSMSGFVRECVRLASKTVEKKYAAASKNYCHRA